jgi:hypothetical protein
MITTISKARQTKCPKDIGKGNGNCLAFNCMAWEFWIPPPGVDIKVIHHGVKDTDKKGYCGLSRRR